MTRMPLSTFFCITLLGVAAWAGPALAADDMDMPGMDMGTPSPTPRPASPVPTARPLPVATPTPMPAMAPAMPGMPMHDPLMAHMHAEGSGTSVNPSASRMYMASLRTGDWLWMLHGAAIAGYDHQGGRRGADTWTAPNWAMLMGSRPLGPGILDLRLMGSLDPFTLPPGGEPQLFQTGETYLGRPLIDHQHPHDLVMELAAQYTWRLNDANSLFFYGGPAGEPALGPAAFMHRPSAEDNHWAPLGHHLQDATHISFGVGTLGWRHAPWQLEGSVFNGREPDENRLDFDLGPLDSYAARLSYFPDPHWVAQVSTGHLTSPEALEPGNDVNRTTASVTNVQDFGANTLATSLIWGQNVDRGGSEALQSYALEGQLDLGDREHLYGRFELLDKDLSPVPGLGLQRIGALTLGGVHELVANDRLNLGLGADATVYSQDPTVAQAYSQNPFSFQVYLRLRPARMQHAGMAMP